MCDDECKILLDKKELNVCKNNAIVLKGYRNPSDGLWDIPIVSSITPNNYVMPQTNSGMYASRIQHNQSSRTKSKVEHKVKKNKYNAPIHPQVLPS